jgi:general secretion pathway protein G
VQLFNSHVVKIKTDLRRLVETEWKTLIERSPGVLLYANIRVSGPHSRENRENKIQGFTLIELLVVLAILGLLIGLVAPAVMRQFAAAKEKIALQSVERLATVLDMYKLDVGDYPTTDQGIQALMAQPQGVAHWNGPYLKGDKLPQDPWGHPFVYRSPSERPGHEYDLYSLGPTGQATGPQDASAIASK